MFGLKIPSHASKQFSEAVAAGHEARAREIRIAELPQLEEQFRLAQVTVGWYADARDRLLLSQQMTKLSAVVQRVQQQSGELLRVANRGDIPWPVAVLVPGQSVQSWMFILKRLGGLDDHREKVSPREVAERIYEELDDGKS